MKKSNRILFLLLITFAFSFLAFMSAINAQTNYYSTSDGNWNSSPKWTPSTPGGTIAFGDTVFVRHNMNIATMSEIIVNGVIVIESAGMIRGDKKITINSVGTLINEGSIH